MGINPMSEVFISRKIFPEALELLRREGIGYKINELDRKLSEEELIERLQGTVGLICMLSDNINKYIIRSTLSLKVISNVAAGFNNVDVAAATARGIMVTNTPGVLSETTADLAFALMIGVARRVAEGDRVVRAGKMTELEFMRQDMGTDIHGKTLGIVGIGRIGLAMARRAHLGFNMKILYHNRRPDVKAEQEVNAHLVSFSELLENSDFISVHVPLTAETRHMFGPEEFKKMRKNAYIINTSRGPVLDEAALAEALSSGTIKGAALDVYEDEPRINPQLLKIKENVLFTPHVGSATIATRTRMALMAAENMAAALKGKVPPNLVNEVASPWSN
jgi:glyoxylate reductase